ncbi:hypothetical protein [Fluviispira multicolorata]|uniref:Spermidine/putrescine transport system substrate-binding protein n=1 Tax=Fluviispira multicolorata TaxID=2654512 RepID=A0A833JHK8_9BACT|nr:hypothetical protein [Fluviispira multicolorata]KAB8033568.1 hypothetical protein GCL57_02345 [Fluviispira multicolorata]
MALKLKKIICYITFFICKKSYCVTIFTWWGYLDNEVKLSLEKECKTTVSYDEYYSNDEFLRRFYKQNYSIAIFSNVVYDFLPERIKGSGTSFKDIKRNYNSKLLKSFNDKKFPDNIGIFAISSSGFLYDPEKILIDKEDDLKTIFSKANGKIVSIIDDPIEALLLINNIKSDIDLDRHMSEFKKLVFGTYPIVTNDVVKLISNKNFAFAYVWSGEAYNQINKTNKNLKFTFHPKTSYISVDLIATLDKDSKTACVAKALSGKKILDPLLIKSFYFSPYGSSINSSNIFFDLENKKYVDNYNMEWISRPSKAEYQQKSNIWQRIKIAIKK